MSKILKSISRIWHPANITRDPLSTFIGLLLILVAVYAFFEAKINFTELLEAIAVFIGFCGINFTNRGGGTAVAGMFLLGLISCAKPPQTSTKTVIKDSTYTVVTTIHDTIHVPGDSVKLIVPSPCPELTLNEGKKVAQKPPKSYKKKTGKASVEVTQDSTGGLEIDCKCEDYQAVIETQNKEIHHLREQVTKTDTTKYVRETPWYDWLARAIALAFVIIILNTILSKFR